MRFCLLMSSSTELNSKDQTSACRDMQRLIQQGGAFTKNERVVDHPAGGEAGFQSFGRNAVGQLHRALTGIRLSLATVLWHPLPAQHAPSSTWASLISSYPCCWPLVWQSSLFVSFCLSSQPSQQQLQCSRGKGWEGRRYKASVRECSRGRGMQ